MKRQGAHSETNLSPKPLPLKRDFEANYSAEKSSSISAEGAPLRKSAKVEWLWQFERERASPALSQIPSHNEVLGRRHCEMSYNPFQPSATSHRLKEEQEASKEQEPNPALLQSRHELDMEVGYEDLSALKSIDRNFSDELKQLDKQQRDAEDAEHTRHLERIIEISKEYREKRLNLRAQQEEQRRQFLEKEAREQLQQPRIIGFHQGSQERAYYSYRPPPSSSTMTPPRHHHGSDVNELYRDRYTQQLPVSRTEPGFEASNPHPQTQVKEGRVPLPAGRVYNNTSKPASSRLH